MTEMGLTAGPLGFDLSVSWPLPTYFEGPDPRAPKTKTDGAERRKICRIPLSPKESAVARGG